MALTDRQKADCQRWMGYGLTDRVGYGRVIPLEPLGLMEALDELSATDEEILTERYLELLPALEQAVLDAGANLGEMSQRKSLYNGLRRDLCSFLGFAPGPALGNGGMTVLLG
jgi:hypothetical protein